MAEKHFIKLGMICSPDGGLGHVLIFLFYKPQTAVELARLTCYYDQSTPKLVIKPAKIEVLNLKPRIVRYFNVITDEEIEAVKLLAGPRVSAIPRKVYLAVAIEPRFCD